MNPSRTESPETPRESVSPPGAAPSHPISASQREELTPQDRVPRGVKPRARRPALVVGGILVALALGVVTVRHFAPSLSADKSAAGTADSTNAADTGGTDAADAAPVPVQVAQVTVRPMETLVSAQGLLSSAPGASARVASTGPGRVAAVLVREGDRVVPGQLLAVIDNRAAQAQTQSAEAAARAAQADAQSAALSASAAQSDARGAVAQATSALQSARAERDAGIQVAQADLSGARSDLRKALAVANPGDLQNAIRQAGLALRAARSDRASAVTQAQNALNTAQTNLVKTQAGPRPQEVTQQQAAVAQAQATRDRAEIEVGRAQRLYDRGIFARRQLDDAQTALQVADKALQSAQAQLDLLRAGARPEDVTAAQLQVDAAREALQAARQSGNDKVAQAQAQLEAAQLSGTQTTRGRNEDARAARARLVAAQGALTQAVRTGAAKVTSAEAALKAAQASGFTVAARQADAQSKRAAQAGSVAAVNAARATAAQNEIRAPLGGVVIKRNLDPGDVADVTTPILEIADPRALSLVAQLPTEEGGAVRTGMAARIRSEAAPDRVFAAQVVSVGSVDPQSGLLSVRLTVANAQGTLKVGALVSCDIVTQSSPRALVVPQAAVLTRDDKPVVFTVEGGKAHQTAVQVGASEGGFVEIRRGVERGATVVKLGQYELEDDASVKVVAPSTSASPSASESSSTSATSSSASAPPGAP